jgi:Protein of unknown function (DUF2726)
MIDYLLRDQTILFAAIIFGAIMIGVALERWRGKIAHRSWQTGKGRWRKKPKLSIVNEDKPQSFDAVQQLNCVMDAAFSSRPLFNKSEHRLFLAIEKSLAMRNSDWRLMAQVSLGEILSSPDKDAYFAVNSKRVDILLADQNGLPLHVIEYQGAGHHQGTAAARCCKERGTAKGRYWLS